MQDTDLALLVDRFMRKIHSGLQERAPGFDREAVGPGGGIVLMTLDDAGRISLNELTKRVARDKSQMTRMIRSLETKGLVQREMSLGDGSAVRLTIARYYTPTGRSIQRPYGNGNLAYYSDYEKRYRNGELRHADSIRVADSLRFEGCRPWTNLVRILGEH